MAVQTRSIKRRIKSIRNTRKITKAMELVAASKMRKAVNAVLGTRPYARLAWSTVFAIVAKTEGKLHLLLRQSEKIEKVLLLVIASDRGLAGGFNANILRRTLATISALGPAVKIEAICVGKRAGDAMRKAEKPIIASFTGLANNPKFEEILPMGRLIIDEFVKGTYDKVVLCYTDYVSAISQRATALDLLPLSSPEALKGLGTLGTGNGEEKKTEIEDYLFEPTPEEVLKRILPRLMETMVYQAVLESSASEHASRMMAMRSASDAAGDMIDALTFTYNQARQAGITREIAEISSGKAALENK